MAHDLFWVVIVLTFGLLLLDALMRRKRQRRPIVMMARPMTRYERNHR